MTHWHDRYLGHSGPPACKSRAGGMATVYEARQIGRSRLTKRRRAEGHSREVRGAARVASSVSSTRRNSRRISCNGNIVADLTIRRIRRPVLMAMEYIRGVTLRALIYHLARPASRCPPPRSRRNHREPAVPLAGLRAHHFVDDSGKPPVKSCTRDVFRRKRPAHVWTCR